MASDAVNPIPIILEPNHQMEEETPRYVVEDPTNSSFSSTIISPNNEK